MVLSATTVAVGAGCATVDGGGDDGDADALITTLAAGERLVIDPAGSAIELRAALDRGDHVDVADVELRVEHGAITVRAVAPAPAPGADPGAPTPATDLVLDAELAFAPVALPDDLGPGDLRLVDVAVATAAPARCTPRWTADQVACDLDLELDLRWSLARDGWTYPLGGQALRPIAVATTVTRTADGLRVDAAGGADGTVWRWAGVAELDEVAVVLAAGADVD
ncbi:MAG: hypothetical protein H6709_21725 [Kofleriaceae bacterium]|nr:hypothetical protein [Kofleriaceae bacterium]